MRLIIAILMQFIGYVCVATVIAAVIAVGYLWQSGSITNDKLFKIMASLQDIDLEAVMKKHDETENEIPEEPSLNKLLHDRALRDRNYELKADQLRRGISEFKHTRELLTVEMERRDLVAKTLDKKLDQAIGLAIDSGQAAVARHMNQMKPLQVKKELLIMLEKDKQEDVVNLLNQLTDQQLKKVLQQFKDDTEIKDLYEQIHSLMAQGVPQKHVIDQAKKLLEDIEEK